MRRLRHAAIRALLVAGVTSSACYRYAPVPITSATNENVRIEITQTAAKRLAADLGVFSTELDGRLGSERRDSLSVHVPIEQQYRGMAVGTTEQTVLLGPSEVVTVRKREFSRGRTVLLAAGAVAGFGALAAGIAQIVDQNQPSDQSLTPPPPSQSRGPRPRTGARFGLRIPLP
jgi:hypothetical protein